MKRLLVLLLVVLAQGFVATRADDAVDEKEPKVHLLNAEELDRLVGRIALFPDPLLALLLPAATQPAEIVMAARWLDREGDPNQIDEQPWSDSLKALAHYPDVLRWMDENLRWTTDLGRAFLDQPEDLMAAIQRLRGMAQRLGNLQSGPQQIVEVEDGQIDIIPVDPEIVYVPIYLPQYIYTRASALSSTPLISFDHGWPVGTWLKHDWDWQNRRVIVWSKESFRPRTWWAQPRSERIKATANSQEWCPPARRGESQSKFWSGRRQQQQSQQAAHPQSVRQAADMNSAARAAAAKPAPAAKH
jgi:hypothetical protein